MALDPSSEIYARLNFVAHMARSSASVAGRLQWDVLRRNVARGVFLYVYVALQDGLLPQLKNLLRKRNALPTATAEKLSRLRDDFGRSFRPVRDNITAHHQVVDPTERWASYRDVRQDYVEVLVQDLEGVLAEMATADGHVLPALPRLATATLSGIASLPNLDGVWFSPGSLAPMQPNTAGIIAGHGDQEFAQACVDSVNGMEELASLRDLSTADLCLERLLKTLIILDMASLMENFVGKGSGTQTQGSLLAAWRQDGTYKNLPTLEHRAQGMQTYLETLRPIRNVCAHLDGMLAGPFSQVLAELDGTSGELLWVSAENLVATFREVCRLDCRSRLFAMPRIKLQGVIGLSGTPPDTY